MDDWNLSPLDCTGIYVLGHSYGIYDIQIYNTNVL